MFKNVLGKLWAFCCRALNHLVAAALHLVAAALGDQSSIGVKESLTISIEASFRMESIGMENTKGLSQGLLLNGPRTAAHSTVLKYMRYILTMREAFSCKYLWQSRFEPITLMPNIATLLMSCKMVNTRTDDVHSRIPAAVTRIFPSSCAV